MSCLKYSGIWLRFTTPLHLGNGRLGQRLASSEISIKADTIFSALCHTALQHGGQDVLNELVETARSGNIAISDGLPYKGAASYLPKPILPVGEAGYHQNLSEKQRKALKKLEWIPADRFWDYLNVHQPFAPEEIDQDFGLSYLQEKVSLVNPEKSEPYGVGLFDFHSDCGLYIIIGYSSEAEKDKLSDLIEETGLSGIGGKRSSGYGKFQVLMTQQLEDCDDTSMRLLEKGLLDEKPTRFITLATSLARENELENVVDGAAYNLVRRGGYVQSANYGEAHFKKQTQFFFAAGSSFETRYEGDLYDVSKNGAHPVYRYGKAMMLGVNL